jgi:hypothetical protein
MTQQTVITCVRWYKLTAGRGFLLVQESGTMKTEFKKGSGQDLSHFRAARPHGARHEALQPGLAAGSFPPCEASRFILNLRRSACPV